MLIISIHIQLNYSKRPLAVNLGILQRLDGAGLRPVGNPGNGDCLYYALAQVLNALRPEAHATHTTLRRAITEWYTNNPNAFHGTALAHLEALDGANLNYMEEG